MDSISKVKEIVQKLKSSALIVGGMKNLSFLSEKFTTNLYLANFISLIFLDFLNRFLYFNFCRNF